MGHAQVPARDDTRGPRLPQACGAEDGGMSLDGFSFSRWREKVPQADEGGASDCRTFLFLQTLTRADGATSPAGGRGDCFASSICRMKPTEANGGMSLDGFSFSRWREKVPQADEGGASDCRTFLFLQTPPSPAPLARPLPRAGEVIVSHRASAA